MLLAEAPSTALQLATPGPAPPPAIAGVDLVGAFLAGRRQTTLRAYAGDLDDFARFVGVGTARQAVDVLVGGTAGQGNALALGYKVDLLGRGLAPATIARRLAALRSMVKLARTLGLVGWSLEVESPRVEAYRDTAGPGRDGWKAILARARAEAATGDRRAIRDLAAVRLLHDLGLRRSELVGIDLGHVEDDFSAVAILGKGRTQRERLTIPAPTGRDLRAWVEARGPEPGPLFVTIGRPGQGRVDRLSDRSVYNLVQGLGRRAGLSRPVRPHGLRHEAITAVLDLNGGDLRAAARFSRHRNLQTLTRYDDNREDLAGRMAGLISDE